ncbi:CARDB domain-containing protein [Natronomonas amylolytica]|uniref:CARDB domain-containing protein n=1 Tax=Natronomonas amylolytica TaxID=3108498 RepID=UPI00300BEC42
MSLRRPLLLLAALALVVSSVMSTGGVSSVSVDRGLDVAVVDDESAYLGFEQTPTNTSNATTNLEVTITNQYPAARGFTTVEVTIDETTVDLAADGTVAPGEETTHTFTSVPCGDRITVEAFGEGVSVRLNRSVACE